MARKAKTTRAKKPARKASEKAPPPVREPSLFPEPEPEADAPAGKRIGMTLRLEPETWLELKALAARQSVRMRRPVSAHELVVAGVRAMLLSYQVAELDRDAEED